MKKKADWIEKVEKKIEKKGTEGVFSAKAKKAGMETLAYAKKIVKELKGKTNGDKAKVKLLRQALFAMNVGKMKK